MASHLCSALLGLAVIDSRAEEPDVVRQFSSLIDPSQTVRENAEAELLRKDGAELARQLADLMGTKAGPKVIEAGLLVLAKKDALRIGELLPSALRYPSAGVRSVALAMVPPSAVSGNITALVSSALADQDVIVRLRAADLLRGRGRDEDAIQVAIEALGSDTPDVLGDPPRPAFIIARSMLIASNERGLVVQALDRAVSEVGLQPSPIKYRLLDLRAYLSGKSADLIYNHVGPPTTQERNSLDRLQK